MGWGGAYDALIPCGGHSFSRRARCMIRPAVVRKIASSGWGEWRVSVVLSIVRVLLRLSLVAPNRYSTSVGSFLILL